MAKLRPCVFSRNEHSPLMLLLHNQPLRGVRVTMPRNFRCPLPPDAPGVPVVTYRGALSTAVNSCPRSCSSRRTLVSISHGYTPAEGLRPPLLKAVKLLLRLLLPLLRSVLTAPTVVLPQRLRLPHLLPPVMLVPARLSVGRKTIPYLLQLTVTVRSFRRWWHSIAAALGVGCVCLPPTSLPTIMLPS